MKTSLIFSFLLSLLANTISAQPTYFKTEVRLKTDSNRQAAIYAQIEKPDNEPAPLFSAAVWANSQTQNSHGVYGSGNVGVRGDGAGFGLFGQASTYGVYGNELNPESQTGRAIYSNGDLEYTGTLIGPASDQKFKTLLKSELSVLDELTHLDVTSYYYKTQEFSHMNFSTKKQYGFLAQEVEKVFPELVHNSKKAVIRNPEGPQSKEEVYKSINYIGFIPLLVNGIQQLNDTNNTLKKRISNLESDLMSLSIEFKKAQSQISNK